MNRVYSPAEWSARLDNLQKRFPDAPRNHVAGALKDAGGHAGMAIAALKKDGAEEQPATGLVSDSKAPSVKIENSGEIRIKVELLDAKRAAMCQYRWECVAGHIILGPLPASAKTTIGELVAEVKARCASKGTIKSVCVHRPHRPQPMQGPKVWEETTLMDLGLEGGGTLAAAVTLE